jgi:hypothetical protein
MNDKDETQAQQLTWDCERRLDRLTRLRTKAFAIGDVERQRSLTGAIICFRRIEDAENNGLLTPLRAARLRALWLSNRLPAEYRLDGRAVPEWIKQQRRAVIQGCHARRMLQVHQARASRLAPRCELPAASRSGQRSRERRPERRVSRVVGSRGDPDPPGDVGPLPVAVRCGACGAYLSPYCSLCLGSPDPGVSVEVLARGVAAVNRATWRRAS